MHSRPRDAETHPHRTWEALSLLQTGLQGACRMGLDSSGALAIALAAYAERGAAPESRIWITCEKGHLAAAGQRVARLVRGKSVRASGSLQRIRCDGCSRVFFAIITEHFRPPKIHSRAGEADFGLCRD